MPSPPIILPGPFRSRLLIDASEGPRRLAEIMEPRQAADFHAADGGWLRAAGMTTAKGPSRVYLERGRGGSKTTDLAVMAAWILLASVKQVSGVAAAADKDQGRLLVDAIEKLARLNPWLGKLLDVQQYRVVNKSSGSQLDIIAADVGSSYGLTPHFLLVDELVHWPREELWVSLFSSVAKRADAMLCIISNAGMGKGESWQWRIREQARTSAAWHFHSWVSPASWISAELLAEQRRLLPDIAYRRLWGNEWTSGTGDALAADLIEQAVTLPAPICAPEPGWQYVAGVDLGISRDASAITVVGRDVGQMVEQPRREQPVRPLWARVCDELDLRDSETGERYVEPVDEFDQSVWVPGTGKLRLASTRVFQPRGGQKIELSAVENALIELHRAFRLAAVAVDPWQAQLLIERLQRAGVPAFPLPFVSENLRAMAQATLDAFNERQISIYRDADLIADLKSLRVKETANSFRLFSVRGEGGTAHSDIAQALSLALLAAKRLDYAAAAAGPPYQGAPLICFP